jgi:hypothetical protein
MWRICICSAEDKKEGTRCTRMTSEISNTVRKWSREYCLNMKRNFVNSIDEPTQFSVFGESGFSIVAESGHKLQTRYSTN